MAEGGALYMNPLSRPVEPSARLHDLRVAEVSNRGESECEGRRRDHCRRQAEQLPTGRETEYFGERLVHLVRVPLQPAKQKLLEMPGRAHGLEYWEAVKETQDQRQKKPAPFEGGRKARNQSGRRRRGCNRCIKRIGRALRRQMQVVPECHVVGVSSLPAHFGNHALVVEFTSLGLRRE